MKNSILDREVRVLGGTADRDLASELHEHLDGLFDDRLEHAVVELKHLRKLNVPLAARLHHHRFVDLFVLGGSGVP